MATWTFVLDHQNEISSFQAGFWRRSSFRSFVKRWYVLTEPLSPGLLSGVALSMIETLLETEWRKATCAVSKSEVIRH